MPTQELIRELFDYRDGKLFRSQQNPSKKGVVSGSLDSRGYLTSSVCGRSYQNHRLIYTMFFGGCPEFLDHINNIKTDNRVENLRPATRAENNSNVGLRRDNTSGVKGVSWHSRDQRWAVRVNIGGTTKHYGYYTDLVQATEVVMRVRTELHGEFCNHGVSL